MKIANSKSEVLGELTVTQLLEELSESEVLLKWSDDLAAKSYYDL
jgi:hypothetical protein